MQAVASSIEMRSLMFAIIATLVPLVRSQVNECGQICISNLLALGSQFGCSSTDATCICKNADFGYGLRDCALEACGPAEEAAVISYGAAFCSSALAAAASGTSSPATNSVASTTISAITGTSATATATVTRATGSSGAGGSGGSVSSSTDAVLTTSLPSATTGPAVSSTSASASSRSSPSSPTTPTDTASSGGLTSGTKAGIGVGVALAVILALLLAIFCFKRRKKQSTQRDSQDLETADPAAAHEMITSANTHEMDAKRPIDFLKENLKSNRPEGFQELEKQNLPPHRSMMRPEEPAEMGAPYSIQSTNAGSDLEHFQPSELEVSAAAAERAELHSQSMNPKSTSTDPPAGPLPTPNASHTERSRSFEPGSPPALVVAAAAASSSSSTTAPGSPEDKLEILRKRMERVREDKERLEKIQALKDLEAELQAEILAEQKKATGI